VANIFQAVGSGLDSLERDLKQEARNNRIQAEALAATGIYNDFESELSKNFLEQQANYDGSYDLEKTNEEIFRNMREDTLSKIDNDNVRNQVDRALSNYQSRYSVQSKAVSLNLEKDIQSKELDRQLSFKISKIHANPDDYANVLADLDLESQGWREDFKRDYYDKYSSALSENYIIAKANELQMARIKNEISQEDFIESRKLLRNFILSRSTPLTAANRESYIKSFDQQDLTLLTKVNKAAQKIAANNFEQSITANKNDDLEIPPGVDKNEFLLKQAQQAYSDNPLKLLQAQIEIETSSLLGAAARALKHGDTKEAENIFAQANLLRDRYQKSGDVYKTNAYTATINTLRDNINAAAKAKNDNLSQFLFNNNDPTFSYLTAIENQKPFGQRNYDNRNFYVYQHAVQTGVPTNSLKFLTDSEETDFRNFLFSLEESGDYEAFQSFSKGLLNNFGTTLAGQHDVLSSVINQIGFVKTDETGKVIEQSPLLAFAIKYAATDSPTGRNLFKLLSVPIKENESKEVNSKMDQYKKAFGEEINKKMDKYKKAFLNYPDLLAKNPVETYNRLLYSAAIRSGNEAASFLNRKSAGSVVDDLIEMTLKQDYELVRNPLLNSDIPIPKQHYTKNIARFTGDRLVFKSFVDDVRNDRLPIPTELLVSETPFGETGELDLGTAEFTGGVVEDRKYKQGVLNPFEVDKQGNLLKVSLEGRGGKLQYKNLLDTGVFLPVGDGTTYRLYAFSLGDKRRSALIFGRSDLDGRPLYFDVSAQDIDRTYGPLYKEKTKIERIESGIPRSW
jgi:hypothetical protein